jgi:hypothetical protein
MAYSYRQDYQSCLNPRQRGEKHLFLVGKTQHSIFNAPSYVVWTQFSKNAGNGGERHPALVEVRTL